jgi:hypothetical protein
VEEVNAERAFEAVEVGDFVAIVGPGFAAAKGTLLREGEREGGAAGGAGDGRFGFF